MFQVNGEEVTAEEARKILQGLGQAAGFPKAFIEALMNKVPAVPWKTFAEIKEYLSKNGIKGAQLAVLDGMISAALKSRDNRNWATQLASLLAFLRIPATVIGKLKKDETPKFPTTVAEISTLLSKVGMSDKDPKKEQLTLLMKLLGSIQA